MKINVTLIKSPIGRLENQLRNLEALGLKKVGQSRLHDDNAVIRGMIKKCEHMVRVEEINE